MRKENKERRLKNAKKGATAAAWYSAAKMLYRRLRLWRGIAIGGLSAAGCVIGLLLWRVIHG